MDPLLGLGVRVVHGPALLRDRAVGAIRPALGLDGRCTRAELLAPELAAADLAGMLSHQRTKCNSNARRPGPCTIHYGVLRIDSMRP
jgi:hypothetical protein